jgi:hypothetical protein
MDSCQAGEPTSFVERADRVRSKSLSYTRPGRLQVRYVGKPIRYLFHLIALYHEGDKVKHPRKRTAHPAT